MHRIHSSAKFQALERPVSHSSNVIQQQNATQQNLAGFPALTKAASHNAASNTLGGQGDSTPHAEPNEKAPAKHNSTPLPPPAPSENTNEKQVDDPSIESEEKPGLSTRLKAGSLRFLNHTKDALFHSWINVLLIFVPIGIAANFAPLPESSKPTVVFALNAVAIIPLAGLLSHATESVASRMGDTWASLLNVTFGNAVELIIFIIALVKNQIRIVQASILGSILANLLLILGMAFLLGGLRFQEQVYNSTVTQMSACLLSLSVISLLLPTAFHVSFSSYATADEYTVKISRGTSIILLLVYVLYLLFQLKSHAYMYESTPQQFIDEESHPGVFADMMNSNSESSSSSESSTDSEASSGSENTTKRRIKKAWRHRRRRMSTASWVQGSSAVSEVSLPSTEAKSGYKSSETPSESYFDPVERYRREYQLSQALSGDEGDTEGDQGVPRIRDFQAEAVEPVKLTSKKDRKALKKHRKIQNKDQKTHEDSPKDNAAQIQTQEITTSHVNFVQEPEEVPTTPGTKKSFAINFVPPILNPFANTVFSSSQPSRDQSGNQAASSTVRNPRQFLRRTSSLPDRLPRSELQPTRQQPGLNQASNLPAALPDGEPQTVAEETQEDIEKPHMSRTAAVMLLLVTTGLVAFCAELLVDAIPEMIADTSVSQAFIGLIVLPIVGNAAEHVTAVTVAAKNKMDLAIGVAVGSSIQIALFITPVIVIVGWILDRDMSLYFNLFETVSLFVTVFVVNFLVLDGRSNYLEGSLLIAGYIIIALAAFFYPNAAEQSKLGGGSSAPVAGYS